MACLRYENVPRRQFPPSVVFKSPERDAWRETSGPSKSAKDDQEYAKRSIKKTPLPRPSASAKRMDGFDPLTDELPSRLVDEDEEADAEKKRAAQDALDLLPAEFVERLASHGEAGTQALMASVSVLVIGTSTQACRLLHAAFRLAERPVLGCLIVPGVPIRSLSAKPSSADTTCTAYLASDATAVVCCQGPIPADRAVSAARALLGALPSPRVLILSQGGPWLAATGDSDSPVFSLCSDAWAATGLTCPAPPLPPGGRVEGLPAALLAACQGRRVPAALLHQPLSRPIADVPAAVELAQCLARVVGALGGIDASALVGTARSLGPSVASDSRSHATASVFI